MFSAAFRRPPHRVTILPFLLLALAGAAEAQVAPATLTLEEAIAIARRNNPDFLAQKNDERESDWAVREAYGALLPSASISTGMQYQAEGTQRFGIFTAEDLGVGTTPSYLSSSYSIGLNYQLGAASLLRPGQERMNRRATLARIDAADFDLTANVTRQYLAVLRAQDAVALTRQELAQAEENLKLAEARVAVGAAIALEAKQAEVERGRAQVEVLKAENLRRTERLRLIEQLGIQLERDVELTSTFTVFEPAWDEEALVAMAIERHPRLRALRAAEDASGTTVKVARSQYLPTLNLSLGWSGYTREAMDSDYLIGQANEQAQARQEACLTTNLIASRLSPPIPTQECPAATISLEQQQRILEGNNVFPFDFSGQPFGAQLTVSLPIFNGFTRERQVAAARVAMEDAQHQLRSEELRIRTEVATAYQNITTAYETVVLERRNTELANEQVELARERYRVGAVSFLDLLEAETLKARADRSYLVAVYTFHEGLAGLEAAVGRTLERPTGGQE